MPDGEIQPERCVGRRLRVLKRQRRLFKHLARGLTLNLRDFEGRI